VLGPDVAGPAGVFHYAPDSHALERRCRIDAAAWDANAADWPPGSFLVGLTSIHWREAWKYGERAFRYCQHDTGHAVAALRYAAALIGWDLRLLTGWSSAALASLLGLDREADFAEGEPEEPACLMLVTPGAGAAGVVAADGIRAAASLAGVARAGHWTGAANRLSPDRVQWDWIDAAAEASRTVTGGQAPAAGQARTGRHSGLPELGASGVVRSTPVPVSSAASLLLRRRSAQSFDGESSIDLDRFLVILRRLLPQSGPPFDALSWEPRVHLVLFVHRVVGLEPGIYALPRTAAGLDALRDSTQPDFAWVRPLAVPDSIPLYLLAPVDCRRIARQLSCAQDIAADGFFSLGMLADFDAALAEGGAPAYRELFWETGAIGQALYLEAEAAGARGTGIGCFFDDGVHDLLGIRDHRFQSLYHFTVGIPVDDPRLTTHPGYPWDACPHF